MAFFQDVSAVLRILCLCAGMSALARYYRAMRSSRLFHFRQVAAPSWEQTSEPTPVLVGPRGLGNLKEAVPACATTLFTLAGQRLGPAQPLDRRGLVSWPLVSAFVLSMPRRAPVSTGLASIGAKMSAVVVGPGVVLARARCCSAGASGSPAAPGAGLLGGLGSNCDDVRLELRDLEASRRKPPTPS